MKSPLLSIIILNWNGRNHIPACLESVLASEYRHFEIIVIDSGSTDGSLDFLRAQQPSIRLVENGCNLGYAAASNIGFKLAAGEYIANLNNDTVVDPAWLNDPIKYLEHDPRIGAVGCRLMDANRPGYLDGLYHIIMPDLGPLPFAFLKKFDAENPRMARPGFVIGAHGGAAIYRKKMIDELNGFDETYWAYYEEIDLCMRAFLRGWKCLYVPSAIVHHKGAASFDRTSANYLYLRERNRLWFIFRNYPLALIIRHLPLMILFELRIMRVLFFKFKYPAIYFKSRWDALLGLPRHAPIRRLNMKLFKLHKNEFERLYREKIIFIETSR